MVGTDKLHTVEKPGSSIDEKLRALYESQPFLQDPAYQALIRECKDLCKGDYEKYKRVLQDRAEATQDPNYQRQIFKVETIEKFERALISQLAQRGVNNVGLAYIIEQFGSNGTTGEDETEKEGAHPRGAQTKVIEFYLGERETG